MVQSGAVIERYELKYHLPPALVEPIREVVARYCVPDPAAPGGRYLISSLYLDTPDFRLYRETMEEAPRRFKLRIRRYTHGPVMLEVKDRVKDVIIKPRVPLPAWSWPGVMLDPAVEAGLDLPPAVRHDLTDFVNRVLKTGAQPSAVIRYLRDAWFSPDEEYARVTFDHRIDGRLPDGWNVPIADGPGWVPLDAEDRFGMPASGVVLELKATASVPRWMMDLVRRFDLPRTGFSKYCSGVDALYGLGRQLPGWRDLGPGRWTRRRSA
jgi:SPX domain protein involved in polyphosphate accumulation